MNVAAKVTEAEAVVSNALAEGWEEYVDEATGTYAHVKCTGVAATRHGARAARGGRAPTRYAGPLSLCAPRTRAQAPSPPSASCIPIGLSLVFALSCLCV
jgi:hypothetical protein